MMNSSRAQEVLYESEAALRLVDQEIFELCGSAPTSLADVSAEELASMLERIDAQIRGVQVVLRDTRASLERVTAQAPGDGESAPVVGHASRALHDVEQRLAMILRSIDPDAAFPAH
jgi:hypothetical protein